jgi:hypothetical protein
MANPDAIHQKSELDHLGLVRALSQEISAAISAIERNQLKHLEAAIRNQETICHALLASKGSPPRLAEAGKPAVEEALSSLAQVNRVYAGVIKRAKRCADLLLALYGQGYGRDVSLVDGHSWSCEA